MWLRICETWQELLFVKDYDLGTVLTLLCTYSFLFSAKYKRIDAFMIPFYRWWSQDLLPHAEHWYIAKSQSKLRIVWPGTWALSYYIKIPFVVLFLRPGMWNFLGRLLVYQKNQWVSLTINTNKKQTDLVSFPLRMKFIKP